MSLFGRKRADLRDQFHMIYQNIVHPVILQLYTSDDLICFSLPQGGTPREATLDQVAQYKADIKEARMKTGRRSVMFIHQTLPDPPSVASDSSGSNLSAKKRGRPKKMKLTDHPHQTIVTTPAALSSSVIKDATSHANNNNSGVEEVCISPTPLQIDLSPSVINNNEQTETETADSEPAVEDTTNTKTVSNSVLNNGQPPFSSLTSPTTVRKPRIRKSHGAGKLSYGEQAKAVEAGGKSVHIIMMCMKICMYVCVCMYDMCVCIASLLFIVLSCCNQCDLACLNA